MSDTKKIKLGLIGVGGVRDIYGIGRGGFLFNTAVKNFEEYEATAICDINPECFSVLKEKYPDMKCFTDYKQMFAETELDLVIVGTAPTDHARFAVAALENNVNVLSEIPIIYDMPEVDALIKAEKESEAQFFTGANPNFAGRLKDLQEMCNQGMLGDPFYMEVSYMHDLRNWFDETPWRASYEPIRYCTHSLGPLLTLFEEDLEYVSCFDTGGWFEKEKEDRHDIMAAIFRTKSNRVIQLSVSYANNFRERDSHRCVVHGTEGVFSWHDPEIVKFNSTKMPGAHIPVELHSSRFDVRKYGNNKKVREAGHHGLDYAMFDSIQKSILNGADYPVSLREGLRMSLPGIYAVESAKRGGELTKIQYPWS